MYVRIINIIIIITDGRVGCAKGLVGVNSNCQSVGSKVRQHAVAMSLNRFVLSDCENAGVKEHPRQPTGKENQGLEVKTYLSLRGSNRHHPTMVISPLLLTCRL